MTGPEDSQSTRPISVAELLAKNGTIGAPPAGGRRRRRRGNSDAVTVAELTGEIPIITATSRPAPPEPVKPTEPELHTNGAVAPQAAETTGTPEADETPETPQADETTGTAAAPEVPDVAEAADGPGEVTQGGVPDAEDEPEALGDARAAADVPAEAGAAADVPAEAGQAPFARRSAADGVAEEMSPDPVIDDDDDVYDGGIDVEAPEADYTGDADDVPSYLRSTQDRLFGGDSVADDLARGPGGGTEADAPDADQDGRDDGTQAAPKPPTLMHAAVIVGQCVAAVALGAGLFVAFDQLWKWNNIVALVLSVLVILGLVVGVRVVRKTEDIGSTLIAVAVGALVTLGPLALLQSG